MMQVMTGSTTAVLVLVEGVLIRAVFMESSGENVALLERRGEVEMAVVRNEVVECSVPVVTVVVVVVVACVCV